MANRAQGGVRAGARGGLVARLSAALLERREPAVERGRHGQVALLALLHLGLSVRDRVLARARAATA
jgi:hypothetical protein